MDESHVQETLSRLLTDESRILNRLVENAERLLRIDKATGEMVLTVPRLFVSDANFLGLILLTRYFASKLGLAGKDSMTHAELVDKSGLDEGTITSLLVELNYQGFVEHLLGGEYRISFSKAEYFLEEARQSMLEERNRSELLEESLRERIESLRNLPESLRSRFSPEDLRRIAIEKELILVLASRKMF